MDELIKTFHIDFSLLIAQLVNFTIVLLVLYKFAYKPILKMMNERSAKIEKGIKDAEEAKQKVEEIEEKERKTLIEAKKAAQKIVDAAEKGAEKNAVVLAEESTIKAQKIIKNAEKKIEEEKNKMFEEVKSDIADLVVEATEKIIKKKLNDEKDKDLINSYLKKD